MQNIKLIFFVYLLGIGTLSGCYVSGNISEEASLPKLPPAFVFDEVRTSPDIIGAERVTTTIGTPGYKLDAVLFNNIEPQTTSNNYQILGVYR